MVGKASAAVRAVVLSSYAPNALSHGTAHLKRKREAFGRPF